MYVVESYDFVERYTHSHVYMNNSCMRKLKVSLSHLHSLTRQSEIPSTKNSDYEYHRAEALVLIALTLPSPP